MAKISEEERRERTQRMISRAREVFTEIAEKHALTLEWDDSPQVELAAHLRKQPGLDFSLWLNLQNDDEIGFQSDWFYADWFPAGDPKVEADFIAALDGVLAGAVRLICKFRKNRDHPYSVEFEALGDAGWTNIYGYRNGFYFGRAKGVMILRNGHDPVVKGRAERIRPLT
ncbi:MAG: hypothetical protein ACRED8_03595 [Caulobacteraceae bacterium]